MAYTNLKDGHFKYRVYCPVAKCQLTVYLDVLAGVPGFLGCETYNAVYDSCRACREKVLQDHSKFKIFHAPD